jgi:hypothetical protein
MVDHDDDLVENPITESLRLIIQSQMILSELQINQKRLEKLIHQLIEPKDKP